MPSTVRLDEQIQVGTTVGLVADSSTFTFDGTGGKPDYRGYEIVISEYAGRGILIKNEDYSWNSTTAVFSLLHAGDKFQEGEWYNVHFQILGVPLIINQAAIITTDFFIRDISLANTGHGPVEERINDFIIKFEQQCLTRLLGYRLYKAFRTESSDRMDDLLNGAEFIDDVDNVKYWQGLVHDTNISLIANYIYYYFQEHNAKQTSGTTTKVANAEAGRSVSPADQMIRAWNFFSSESWDLLSFLWIKKDSGTRVYPEFTAQQFYDARAFSKKINFFGL